MNEEKFPQHIMRYCPLCGAEAFVKYGEKACKCGKCGFVYYFNAATAVAVIIKDEKGRVLLTRRAFEPGKGMLDLPGGFVDPMEPAENAVRREIKEELDLSVTSMNYLGSFPNTYLYGGIVYFTCDLVFEVEVETLQGIHAMDDVDAFDFYEITEDVIAKVGADSIKKILRTFCL